jgi:glutaredoxin
MTARRALIAALLLAATGLAQAGSIEDLFRGWIDRAKQDRKWAASMPLSAMAHEIARPSIGPRADGLALGRDQYAIFVAPRCRSCTAAVERLRQRGYNVEVLDLATSQTAREAFELSGAKGVPTVLAGKQMMGGYTDKLFDRLVRGDIQDKINNAPRDGA